MDFCISLLDQKVLQTEYDCALTCATAALGVHSDGRWKATVRVCRAGPLHGPGYEWPRSAEPSGQEWICKSPCRLGAFGSWSPATSPLFRRQVVTLVYGPVTGTVIVVIVGPVMGCRPRRQSRVPILGR
jgi:hypothetical protein